jgi:hypothetical protein
VYPLKVLLVPPVADKSGAADIYLLTEAKPLSDVSLPLETPKSFPALLASDDLNGAMYQASLSPVMMKFT